MKRHTLMIAAATVAAAITIARAAAQTADPVPNPERSMRAWRVEKPPVIDGTLGDACWEEIGEWSGGFTQQSPDPGAPSRQQTWVKILYDNQNVYVAFRNLDTEPDRINGWLAPRDQILGDAVYIDFDSYNDRRTAFAFALTAGGTRADFVKQNGVDDDYTWNAVWEGRTSSDTEGWYAEFRIPLSQLRYTGGEGPGRWGVHAVRTIDRFQEHSHLHLIPRENRGVVYEFATLEGIADLPPSRRVEFTPYASLKNILAPRIAGNPYRRGHRWSSGLGLDGKIGLSSAFTLDFTVNPDFGQVEADPSTINLTSVETVYEEKRPFFLEGKSFYNMPTEDMQLFYSRRIGAPSGWSPALLPGEHSRLPTETNILSAFKASGKSRGGLALSVLNSITARESALISSPEGNEHAMVVSPLTSYTVARVQQDIDGGNTTVGGFFSGVNRSLRNHDHLGFMTRDAWVGAVDFNQYFGGRDYWIKGTLMASRIEGSREAITRLQRSPVHFFQREGAPHLEVDSAATHLSGNGGYLAIGRGGKRKFASEQVFVWRTPGFEINDAGYLSAADDKLFRGYLHWRESIADSRLLTYHSYYLFYRFQWDYSGLNTMKRVGFESNFWFVNKYYLYLNFYRQIRTVDKALLRGGPPMLFDPFWGVDFELQSDVSRKVSFDVYQTLIMEPHRFEQNAHATVKYRPMPNLGLSLRGDFSFREVDTEWAASPGLISGPGQAWLLGHLRQTTASLTLRADYSITPDLSIQFYGSPFVSTGRYTDFKRATATLDPVYENRFRPLGANAISYDAAENRYAVSDHGERYAFANPDFSFREFRFNLVLRWEFRPNSNLYLVWGQERSGTEPFNTPSLGRNVRSLFGYSPTNVVMTKISYWHSF